MTEMIILVVAILLATAWTTIAVPNAIRDHYEQNREVLTGPM